jgi:nucleotide-binding universal stress UspA family protein
MSSNIVLHCIALKSETTYNTTSITYSTNMISYDKDNKTTAIGSILGSSVMTANLLNTSRILVAIDGSEMSMKAAEYAIDLLNRKEEWKVEEGEAKEVGPKLIGLTVIELSKPGYSLFASESILGRKELKEERKEANQYLNKVEELAKQKSNNNIKFKSQVIEDLTSRVGFVIVDYAERENVNLIVVGTRGRSGFKKLLLGSVASDVLKYAHCPVLVVK